MIKGHIAEKMSLIGSFEIERYDSVGLIHKQFQDGLLTLVKQEDKNRYSWQDPFDLLDGKNWGTYDRCREAKISSDGTVIVTVWEGDNMYGDKTKVRWVGTFKGFKDFHLFEGLIDSYFKDFVIERKRMLDKEKERKELEKIAKRLLKVN